MTDVASRRTMAFGNSALILLMSSSAAFAEKPAQSRFRIEESTIAETQQALLEKRTTCHQVIEAYFARIKAHGGVCVHYGKPDLTTPSGKGIQLHALTPVPHAGQVNAFANLNIRGQRSETDLIDQDPARPDALEVADQLDRFLARNHRLAGSLHCVALAVKDQFDTADLRTTDGSYTAFANDRPAKDSAAVAKAKAAGAVIIGKANMGEYASAPRSTYGGQVCNPYSTDREAGASSSGSGASVSANLASVALAEESMGSVLDPATRSGIVGIVPTFGLISRDGMWRANLLRERVGVHSRTVADGARVLDALVGYDPRDPVTAAAVNHVPAGGFARHAHSKSLAGKRIGVIREFMVEFTPADRDSIRVANQAIAELRAAGAIVLESINPRDIAKYGAVDDPKIPNLSPSIQESIAATLPYLEPGLDKIVATDSTYSWPKAKAPIDTAVDLAFDHGKFPDWLNIRVLASTPKGEYNEQKFTLNRYLRDRGDANIHDLAGLGKKTIAIYDGKKPPTTDGDSLDTAGQAQHLYRKQALTQILLKVMADNHLDALVFPHQTTPPNIIGAPPEPAVENREYRGWNAITDVSGFPAIVVPAGFTEEVYDRVAADPKTLQPAKRVSLPLGLTFLGRPYEETKLLEIASAFEFLTRHRRVPPGF